MPRRTVTVTSPAALGNGVAFLTLVAGAAANFKITGIVLGINNSGGAITDFDVTVGLNRCSAAGTTSATTVYNLVDPGSGATNLGLPGITWSVAPTFAATDTALWSFNSRGGLALNFNEWDYIAAVGTAVPFALVQRSGAALPAAHSITATVSILE